MLGNGNESSNEPRDIRIGHVALIAGQPAVPNSTLTLPCQKAKRVRTHVPLSSNYASQMPSRTEQDQPCPGDDRCGPASCGLLCPAGIL